MAPECGSCCLSVPVTRGCGGITRKITLPPISSENSAGLLSNLRRIPSAERSRGASANAQFTWKKARRHQKGVLRREILGAERISTQKHGQDRRDNKRDNHGRNETHFLVLGRDTCAAA